MEEAKQPQDLVPSVSQKQIDDMSAKMQDLDKKLTDISARLEKSTQANAKLTLISLGLIGLLFILVVFSLVRKPAIIPAHQH